MRILGPWLLAAILGLSASDALAQAAPARQQAADLSRQLMSPFCPGKLLADCTSPSASELRRTLAARLEAGESVEAIKADVVAQFGTEILGAPPLTGIGLLVWVVPALLGIGSAGAVARRIARAVPSSPPAVASSVAADAAALAHLDDELRDLD